MPYNLFGFAFKNKKAAQPDPPSFAPPQNDDGAVVIEQGGAYASVIDLDGIVKNEIELITKYREMAQRSEVEGAISEIVNEAIVTEEEKSPVALVTDKLNYSDDIVKKIQEEFENILNLLDFNNEGQDIFRRWYIDGRLYFHMVINNDNPRDGIQELRYIDPRRIKPVIETETYVTQEGIPMQTEKQRYYVYNQFGTDATTATTGVKIAWDSICYVHSGIQETNNTMILGHLHKALKPSNMLTMIEDASVIYRLSRAPERRLFYIDVGNLPKQKAEQYLKDIMSKYRNKMVYDATTGEIREDKKFLSFMEDYWLPRREGGRGTEISTLPGGENLGEMADIEYFKEKLYQSLNVPVSRLKSESTMSFGEGAAITREEVKFGKFIHRLRNRYTELFDVLLSTQLMLKGIIAKEDWRAIRQKVFYSFLKDTYYTELKMLEIIQQRVSAVDRFVNYAGKLVSWEWVRRNLLMQTDEEMKQLDAQMMREKSDPRYQQLEMMGGMMGGGMPPGGGGDMGGGMEGGGDPGANPFGGDEGGDEGQMQQGPPPAEMPNQGGDDEEPPQSLQSMQAGAGDDEEVDPDELPTEKVTKNVEALWRR
jgi:Bacteriophage T4-like portal protein (Gp20)